jgi:hypothetical protein
MWQPIPGHPLQRFFSGITESTFYTRFGVVDPPLVDYLSELLIRFVHTDAIFRLRDPEGRTLQEVPTMLDEANKLPEGGRTRREYLRHIGDVSLFWIGLFPEALNRRPAVWGHQAQLTYTICGKKSYFLASQSESERFEGESDILKRLSERFELCASGLREVRREWEESPDGFRDGGLTQ